MDGGTYAEDDARLCGDAREDGDKGKRKRAAVGMFFLHLRFVQLAV